MPRCDVCLVNDALINYSSDKVYSTAQKTYVHLRTLDEEVSPDVCCFYDSHPIKGKSVGLPKKLNGDGSFTVWGHFCSLECARSFVTENRSSCHVEKEFSLLALMGIKTFGIHFRLYRAPDKFLLKMFGGPMDIDEWRKENLSGRLWVIKTPGINRTFQAYECFLNLSSSGAVQESIPTSRKEVEKATKFELEKRKTPAHFTKKSLLSLVKNS